MTPRRRAILIVGLILLLIAIIVAVIIWLAGRVAPQPDTTTGIIEAPTDIGEPAQPAEVFANPLIVAPAPTPGNTAGRQMAELFAERYGSYSNQGDYRNLRDLLPVMSAGYRSRTEAFLATAQTAPGQPYEGVTSVKVSTDVRSMTDDEAVIAVTLQQERSTGTAAPAIAYRTLRMELLRSGENWLVDAAVWED